MVFLDLSSSGCDKTLSLFCSKSEFSPCAFYGGVFWLRIQLLSSIASRPELGTALVKKFSKAIFAWKCFLHWSQFTFCLSRFFRFRSVLYKSDITFFIILEMIMRSFRSWCRRMMPIIIIIFIIISAGIKYDIAMFIILNIIISTADQAMKW